MQQQIISTPSCSSSSGLFCLSELCFTPCLSSHKLTLSFFYFFTPLAYYWLLWLGRIMGLLFWSGEPS